MYSGCKQLTKYQPLVESVSNVLPLLLMSAILFIFIISINSEFDVTSTVNSVICILLQWLYYFGQDSALHLRQHHRRLWVTYILNHEVSR